MLDLFGLCLHFYYMEANVQSNLFVFGGITLADVLMSCLKRNLYINISTFVVSYEQIELRKTIRKKKIYFRS